MNKLGFRTAAMALTDDSISIDHPILAAEPRLAIVMGTEAVSYTHLDVYKRQMEQNGYDCSRKKASDVDIYCHQPWDYVITLCEEAKEVEGDFNKEVKNWKHFSFDDPFQHVYGDETELEYRISELYETMYCELYEFYREMCIRDRDFIVYRCADGIAVLYYCYRQYYVAKCE